MADTGIIQKQQFNVHYRPGTADEAVLNESFENDLFFTGTPEYEPRQDHVIIDIGAHIGCFSLLAASKVPGGKVYAFEPGAETFSVLKENIRDNPLPNLNAYPLAVAGKEGKALLYHDTVTGNWGHSITKALSAESEEVKCITLERFLQTENIGRVDFIKFNCEGAEFSIIMNTPSTVFKKIDCMLILYHGYLESNISVNQVDDHLRRAGYHLHYRFTNKEDNSGWLIAYRAGLLKNLAINFRTVPLRTDLFVKEMKRKFGRARQVLFRKKA